MPNLSSPGQVRPAHATRTVLNSPADRQVHFKNRLREITDAALPDSADLQSANLPFTTAASYQ